MPPEKKSHYYSCIMDECNAAIQRLVERTVKTLEFIALLNLAGIGLIIFIVVSLSRTSRPTVVQGSIVT